MTPLGSPTPAAASRVRPATFDDGEAIGRLHERNGLGQLDATAWRKSYETHPFPQEFPEFPLGWVLETENGAIAGSLGNVPMLYDLGGRKLRAAIASAWAVDAEYRGKSLHLLNSFYKQKGVELWLNGSANPATSQVLTAIKMPRMPIPDYAVPCFWAVRPRAFAKAALERRSTPAAALLAYPAGLALLARDIFLRSGRGRIHSNVQRVTGFDERFDRHWQKLCQGTPRLRAYRDRAALEWRFGPALRQGHTAILTARQGEELLGYTVLTRREGSELGMDLFDVVDLQAAGDNPAVLRDLLLGAFQLARKEGADAVKLMTGTPAKRAPAEALRPYTYQLPLWQLYYKASTPELTTELGKAEAWDFSLFDTY